MNWEDPFIFLQHNGVLPIVSLWNRQRFLFLRPILINIFLVLSHFLHIMLLCQQGTALIIVRIVRRHGVSGLLPLVPRQWRMVSGWYVYIYIYWQHKDQMNEFYKIRPCQLKETAKRMLALYDQIFTPVYFMLCEEKTTPRRLALKYKIQRPDG